MVCVWLLSLSVLHSFWQALEPKLIELSQKANEARSEVCASLCECVFSCPMDPSLCVCVCVFGVRS